MHPDSARRGLLAALPAWWAVAGCTTPAPPAPPTTPAPPAPPTPEPRPWTGQPAFSVVRVEVRDGKAFGDYAAGHAPTVAAFGGRFLAAGALPQRVEGRWPERRMVIHQWPRAQAFVDWYDSAAYAPWKTLRHGASSAEVVLVQGVAASAATAAGSDTVPAFVVIDVDVHDAAAFGRYVQGHMPGLRAGGGEFLAAGGRFQVVEGGWAPRRLVLHRWPDAAAFRGWYESPEYRPWRELRWAAARADVALLAGISEKQRAERRLP